MVELSVVLVIIGLLIGGILVVQSMLQASGTLRTIKDLEQYTIAVENFKSVYRSMPGDSKLYNPPGNNDGIIDIVWAGDCAGTDNAYANAEMYQAFSHLSQANIIPVKYVPYSPATENGEGCGGPHNVNYDAQENAGIVAPYSSLYGKTANLYSSTKMPLFMGNVGTSEQRFNYIALRAGPEDAISLENKLGVSADYATAEGEIFSSLGRYKCFDLYALTVDCSSSQAIIANLYYILRR